MGQCHTSAQFTRVRILQTGLHACGECTTAFQQDGDEIAKGRRRQFPSFVRLCCDLQVRTDHGILNKEPVQKCHTGNLSPVNDPPAIVQVDVAVTIYVVPTLCCGDAQIQGSL